MPTVLDAPPPIDTYYSPDPTTRYDATEYTEDKVIPTIPPRDPSAEDGKTPTLPFVR